MVSCSFTAIDLQATEFLTHSKVSTAWHPKRRFSGSEFPAYWESFGNIWTSATSTIKLHDFFFFRQVETVQAEECIAIRIIYDTLVRAIACCTSQILSSIGIPEPGQIARCRVHGHILRATGFTFLQMWIRRRHCRHGPILWKRRGQILRRAVVGPRRLEDFLVFD